MFRDDFVWGVASSAYQIEGRDADDGAGTCMWDLMADEGKFYEGQNAYVASDELHRYKEDIRIMAQMGIKAYRFSISWSRLIPDGTGEVNEKGVTYYRNVLQELLKYGIEPYITLYHWELPEALNLRGGWLNPESPLWFENYAAMVAERFSDLCENFITVNEPQCTILLGYVTGEHAPGLKVSYRESFLAAHHLLMAHGRAVKALRSRSVRPVKVGYGPTCGVAYPASDKPEDIEAARQVYLGSNPELDRWAWTVTWFSDPILLGHYPEEGLKAYAKYLPEFTQEEMNLIHQPLDFMGQNIYNGYAIRAGADGKPEYVDRELGNTHTDTSWPVTPQCLYWGIKFLYDRYHMPIYITENGMACHDEISPDGRVHDPNRIDFLNRYISAVQKATDEGADVRGYFLWTFLDNLEWNLGFSKRFGIIYVDFATQQRIVKDSAYWYRDTIRQNGANLMINLGARQILFLEPVFTHNIWGGHKLKDEFGYPIEGKADDIGECWGIAAHKSGDASVKFGDYAGKKLSSLWKEQPQLFGGHDEDAVFPLLIKIIDAQDDLSIQVHPDDAYAGKNENGSLGKMECWYILDCGENASLVVGHNAKTREELCDMIDNGKWSELIREVPVKKGDFVQIDPGTVHAIKGGIVLLETQQSSDITYRLYDYDRLQNGQPRPLHLAQSKDVITVPAPSAEDSVLHETQTLEGTDSTKDGMKGSVKKLHSCQYYSVYRMFVNGKLSFTQDAPFILMTVANGEGLVNGSSVKKGDHFILPYGYGEVEMEGKMQIIASAVQDIPAFE